MIKKYLFCMACFAWSLSTMAQNTGGVFPPFVNPGFQSLQYRVAIDTDRLDGDSGVAHRIHYLDAINDDFQAVVFAGFNRTPNSEFDFDYLHAGLFWDLGEDGRRYRTGVRFDARIREGGRPNQVGVNWMNQFYLDNGWNLRATLLTAVQLGDRANDGLNLQTRWQLAKRLESGQGVGLEMFSFYGSTDNLGNFNSQNHALGPTYTVPFGSGWSAFSSVLFGISESAPDTQLRFWLSRTF